MHTQDRRALLQEQVDAYNEQVEGGQKDTLYLKTLKGSALTMAKNEGLELTVNPQGKLEVA